MNRLLVVAISFLFFGCSGSSVSAEPTLSDVIFEYHGDKYSCEKVIGVGDKDDNQVTKVLFLKCKDYAA